MKVKKLIRIICLLLYFFFLVLIFFSLFVNKHFNNISFEQLLYNITDTKGANYDIVLTGCVFVFFRVFLVCFIVYIIFKLYKLLKIKFDTNNKIIKCKFFKNNLFKEIILLIIFLTFSLNYSSSLLNFDDYIESQFTPTMLFEDYYVDARNVELKFPKKKRNLIYIFAESMESTNFSKENGGIIEKSYIPKLEKLAKQNINFSNNDKLGGALQVNNTNWTTAALIAHTSGIPLKLSMKQSKNNKFLPGLYSLGDILQDNGYNNYIMFGSDAEFGSRKDYFESHGNYTIYDYYYAIDNHMIDDDYYIYQLYLYLIQTHNICIISCYLNFLNLPYIQHFYMINMN